MNNSRRNTIMWEVLMVCFAKMGRGEISVLTPQLFTGTVMEMVTQKKLGLQDAHDFMEEFQKSIVTCTLQEMDKQDTRPQMGGVKRTPRQMQ